MATRPTLTVGAQAVNLETGLADGDSYVAQNISSVPVRYCNVATDPTGDDTQGWHILRPGDSIQAQVGVDEPTWVRSGSSRDARLVLSTLTTPPVGYRAAPVVTVGTVDINFDPPRSVQAATAGDLTYVDSLGDEHTINGMAVGDNVAGPGGGLVLVSIIRGASTVTSVLTGIV